MYLTLIGIWDDKDCGYVFLLVHNKVSSTTNSDQIIQREAQISVAKTENQHNF